MLKIRKRQLDQMSKVLLKDDAGSLVAEVKETDEPIPAIGKGVLCVRDEQIELLSRQQSNEFVNRAQAYLKGIFLDWGAGDAVFRTTFINITISQATALAITREIDVIRYIELMFRIAPEHLSSSNYAWIGEYLGEKRSAEERLNLIVERLRFDVGIPL